MLKLYIYLEKKRPKKLLVFFNPIGGKKQGRQIYRYKVAPIFELARISTDVISIYYCWILFCLRKNYIYLLVTQHYFNAQSYQIMIFLLYEYHCLKLFCFETVFKILPYFAYCNMTCQHWMGKFICALLNDMHAFD